MGQTESLNYANISTCRLRFDAKSEVKIFFVSLLSWRTSVNTAGEDAALLFYERRYVYQTTRCHTL